MTKSLKRWLGALFAAAFLSTATLHAFAHLGASDADAGCAVCVVQHSGAVSAPAPRVVAPVPVSSSVVVVLPSFAASRAAAVADARGPPAGLA